MCVYASGYLVTHLTLLLFMWLNGEAFLFSHQSSFLSRGKKSLHTVKPDAANETLAFLTYSICSGIVMSFVIALAKLLAIKSIWGSSFIAGSLGLCV